MNYTNFFEKCKTIDEVKQLYRELAKKYHPDKCQDKEIFKSINNQYDSAINKLKDKKSSKKAESQVFEAKVYKDIIEELIKHADIQVEICGWWLWINCPKEKKDILKQSKYKFSWSRKKKEWYYRPSWYRSNNRQEWTKDQIRQKYGSTKFANNKTEKQLLTV